LLGCNRVGSQIGCQIMASNGLNAAKIILTTQAVDSKQYIDDPISINSSMSR